VDDDAILRVVVAEEASPLGEGVPV
jgi:hypothetical protein